MKLSEELSIRGFIHQHTNDKLDDVIGGEQKRTIYHGIDPSADSAHVGNMVVWLLLRHLANNGHRIIFLVGGGTGMIGDPKPDSERVLQDESVTDSNVEKIKLQAQSLIGGDSAEITFVNNKDWLAAEGLLTFLRDIGKHFTVNELIKKDAIAKRLSSDNGISYTEFAYPLLQGYDYLVLHRQYGCDVQVGGSDQWGNIVAGVDLVRRKEQHNVHALTVPLIVDKATGKKFGKSEGNAVWLDAKKTSPYEFYQFWLNVTDINVHDYLKLFTFLSLTEIDSLMVIHNENPAKREAQRKLAFEVTKFVHKEELAKAVERVSQILFEGGDIDSLLEVEKQVLLENAPIYKLETPSSIVDLLVDSGLATSKREARQFVETGAITYNEEKVLDETLLIQVGLGEFKTLRRGKKSFVILYK